MQSSNTVEKCRLKTGKTLGGLQMSASSRKNINETLQARQLVGALVGGMALEQVSPRPTQQHRRQPLHR